VDGVTFSLLSRFLCCRERFRLYAVEGLRPVEQFNHRIEYGNLIHLAEEAYLGGQRPWTLVVADRAKELCQRFPMEQEQIEHWYQVCLAQFPVYIDYWKTHEHVKHRIPLLQEYVFDVPYTLPGGPIVRLRGKWDSVDVIGAGTEARIYLQENKVKGNINEKQIRTQLSFDLQTMLYAVALQIYQGLAQERANQLQTRIGGLRYNLIRRPLSGGKDSIKQHLPSKSNPRGETKKEFYKRLGKLIAEKPEWYFMRWQVEITGGDIQKFSREFLDPCLENLCSWWDWITTSDAHFGLGELGHPPGQFNYPSLHWRTPFGVYDVLREGGSHELDEYLSTGSAAGLERVDNLFSELQ
jgi:hypothetical protein